jgi:DNA-binding transcriptional regulator YiaG
MEAGYHVKNVDPDGKGVTFRKPTTGFQVKRMGDTVLWNSELIKALRLHMGLTQAEFAKRLGVRQTTVSQRENSVYQPTLATSKYLTLVAEQVEFNYGER